MIAEVNGREVGYEDVGSGLPLVLLHGFPHDRSLWSPQMGALTVGARTLACDLRGFGESTGVANTIDEYADDVLEWLGTLDTPPAVIGGISMGGYIVFSMWRKAPDRFRAMLLCDTRAGADDDSARTRRDEQIALVRERGVPALADRLIQGMVGKSTRENRPETTERIHTMLASADAEAVCGALAALRDRPDSTDTLATIDVPTLIVVGDEDVITPATESRAMHDAIHGSQLEVVRGAGHLTNVERPAAFNHVLNEFLASVAYT
jgi:3-oxoadipate enol-lactonase